MSGDRNDAADDSAPAGPRAHDARAVARLFSRRRLATADDFLFREVARRLGERLATIRVDATRVVDLGAGAGADRPALVARFPGATIVGVDVARAPLDRAGNGPRARWWRRASEPPVVQADFAALPFAAGAFDVLWSNCALHWSAAPHVVLPEWSRVARTGALVAFSTFGPDTLAEVRSAFRAVDDRPHVPAFTDLHDYGDLLVAAGFTAPVVDMERLVLTYAKADDLWTDVRALGGDPHVDRLRGLRGRGFRVRLDAGLDATRDADGRFRLTFELVYAHAWKGEPRRTRAGDAIVRVERRR